MILTLTLNPALDSLIFLEKVQWHAKNIAVEKRLYCSGKGFNVAKALAALGRPVTALGFVGGADIPRYRDALAARGAQLAVTSITATRTNLKLIERDTGLETEVNEPGAVVSESEAAALHEKVSARLAGADWLVLSGSIAPGVSESSYAEIISEAKTAGVRTLLDSSGPYLRAGVAACPTVLRINRAELNEVTNVEGTSVAALGAAAARLLETGIELVVVSLGREGALLASPQGRWLAQPPPLVVVNAIGAGDVMSAGVVDAWERELAPDALLRWATALASASVLTLESGEVDPQVARELESRIASNPI